jgi:hypothetical protein
VPWPTYTRHRVRRGSSTRTTKPFLVKPLDAHAVHRLKTRDLATPPYAEDYCVPWGWAVDSRVSPSFDPGSGPPSSGGHELTRLGR